MGRFGRILLSGRWVYTIRRNGYRVLTRRDYVWGLRRVDFLVLMLPLVLRQK